MKHSYSNDDTCFSIDVIDEILEEDFDALLGEGSEILHSIEGPILEEKLIAEFDEFMAMTIDENSESESNTEKPPFEKITFNTDYKIKTSLEEPSMDLELKPLPDNLEYIFLEEPSFLPVIISSQLSEKNKNKLVSVLDVLSLYGKKGGFSLRDWHRLIPHIGYFLGVWTKKLLLTSMNIILIPYLEYGVLSFSGYGVLIFILCGRLVSAGTDTPYLLDGYGVLVFRIVIFKISSFKLQNARLLLSFTNYSIITAILKYK
ncbi:hypothetical protein Tco_0963355 [Tanacetum coccineum]